MTSAGQCFFPPTKLLIYDYIYYGNFLRVMVDSPRYNELVEFLWREIPRSTKIGYLADIR